MSFRITLPENKKHWDKVQMLMSFWRLPSIIVGPDIVCECSGTEIETPMTVKRMFTVKVVPKLTPDMMGGMVTDHVFNVCKEINCQSKVDCEMVYGARSWLVDFRNPIYEAARRATIQVSFYVIYVNYFFKRRHSAGASTLKLQNYSLNHSGIENFKRSTVYTEFVI